MVSRYPNNLLTLSITALGWAVAGLNAPGLSTRGLYLFGPASGDVRSHLRSYRCTQRTHVNLIRVLGVILCGVVWYYMVWHGSSQQGKAQHSAATEDGYLSQVYDIPGGYTARECYMLYVCYIVVLCISRY